MSAALRLRRGDRLVLATHNAGKVSELTDLLAPFGLQLVSAGELGLPEPESLVGGEELQRFLASQLPQRLKRRALRTLWRSNPVLACLDGLNDYEDDFTDAAVVKEGMQTLYQVGRGFAERVQEIAEKLPEAAEAEPEAELAAEAPAPLPEPPTQMTLAEPAPAPEAVEEEPAADILPPRFRRMQFQFDEGRPA